MDKTEFSNINLSEFISDTVDILSIEMNKSIVKCLLKDIINIYNGFYWSYDFYKNEMNRINSNIKRSYDYNMIDYKVKFVYTPRHIILEEFAFNYIKNLKEIKDVKENK